VPASSRLSVAWSESVSPKSSRTARMREAMHRERREEERTRARRRRPVA
jgi:hypothetical protein